MLLNENNFKRLMSKERKELVCNCKKYISLFVFKFTIQDSFLISEALN